MTRKSGGLPEKRIRTLEAEISRVSSIHHPDCSFLQGCDAGTCDCKLEPSWLADAYRHASAERDALKARVAELEAENDGLQSAVEGVGRDLQIETSRRKDAELRGEDSG